MTEPSLIPAALIEASYVPPPCAAIWLVRYVNQQNAWSWLRWGDGNKGTIREFNEERFAMEAARTFKRAHVIAIPGVQP